MSFSVVSTIKSRVRGKFIKEVCAVPSSWVQQNILFWPNDNLKSKLSNANSVPDITWKSSKCIIHKEHITSYEEALMWEEKYSEINTEDEENLSVSYIINNTPKAITTPSQSSSKEETYNNMFVISNIDNVSDGIYADNTPIEIINNEIKHNNAHECDCKSRHIETQKMLSRIEARMENLTSSLVSMRIVLERLEHKSFTTLNVQPVPVQVERSTVFEEKLSFPITTAEHILELNAELKNEEYSTFLKEKFGKVLGNSGQEKNSARVSMKFVSEILFTKQLLTNTSWTGISRTSSVTQKIPFRTLSNIIKFINDIMSACDSRWIYSDTEKLLKDKILKHSKTRNEAEKAKMEKKPAQSSFVPQIIIENDEEILCQTDSGGFCEIVTESIDPLM